MKIKFGILLPTRGIILNNSKPDFNKILSIADIAETENLESLWVGDSLTAKPRLDPLITLSALSTYTKKILLGTAVLLPGLREPLTLCRSLNTLDVISQGRIIIAAGVGGAFTSSQIDEWKNVNVNPKERTKRLEEIIEIFKLSSSGNKFSFSGNHFNFKNVCIKPASVQKPHIKLLLACHSHSGNNNQYKRMAKYADGFITISEKAPTISKLIDNLENVWIQNGKNINQMDRTIYLTVNINEDKKKSKEESDKFIKSYYGLNFWEETWGPFGTPEEVIQEIKTIMKTKISRIILRFASFSPEKQLKLFLEKVYPQL